MKIGCLFTFLVFVGIFFLIKDMEEPKWSQIDYCLDRGYCWDYIRDRCEEIDQGYCVKNEFDCIDRNGSWNEEKKYCKLK